MGFKVGQLFMDGMKNRLSHWLSELFKDFVASSYWVCVIGGMIGLILYIAGYNKGKNYPLISLAIYLIINIIGSVLLNA